MKTGFRAVRYNHLFLGGQFRPNANLELEVHQELGRALKAAINAATGHPRASSKIDAIRSELDEWAMRETTTQHLDQVAFNSIYYGVADEPSFPVDRNEIIRRLEGVIDIVVRYYPVCTPSKALVALARQAIHSVGTKPTNGGRSNALSTRRRDATPDTA